MSPRNAGSWECFLKYKSKWNSAAYNLYTYEIKAGCSRTCCHSEGEKQPCFVNLNLFYKFRTPPLSLFLLKVGSPYRMPRSCFVFSFYSYFIRYIHLKFYNNSQPEDKVFFLTNKQYVPYTYWDKTSMKEIWFIHKMTDTIHSPYEAIRDAPTLCLCTELKGNS